MKRILKKKLLQIKKLSLEGKIAEAPSSQSQIGILKCFDKELCIYNIIYNNFNSTSTNLSFFRAERQIILLLSKPINRKNL